MYERELFCEGMIGFLPLVFRKLTHSFSHGTEEISFGLVGVCCVVMVLCFGVCEQKFF